MSKRSVLRIPASFLFTAVMTAVLPAQAAQKVVYVNGMNTEWEDALTTQIKIQQLLAASPGHIPDRRTFSVGTVWNPIGWYGTTSFTDLEKVQDGKEIFIQKMNEERLYTEYRTSFDLMKEGLSPSSVDLQKIGDNFMNPLPGYNSVQCTESPPESEDCMSHDRMNAVRLAVSQLLTEGTPAEPVIVVAHSQGNLIANQAYAVLAHQQGWNYAKQSMRVMNLANTSLFSPDGLDITHSGDTRLDGAFFDLVTLPANISATRYVQSMGWTNGTDSMQLGCGTFTNWAVCDFKLRGATFSASNTNGDGHSVDNVYLSNTLVSRTEPATVSGVSTMPANATFARYFEQYVYHAAEQLGVHSSIPPAYVAYGDKTRMFPNSWTGSAVKTTNSSGTQMRIAVTQTNMNYGVVAQNFDTLEGVLRVRATHKMHAGYDAYGYRRNFFPSLVLVQGSTSVNVAFSRSTYAAHYCYNPSKFDKVRISFGSGADDCMLSSTIQASSLYDSVAPIETTFVFNTRTGDFRLTVTNGSSANSETYQYTGTVPAENRLPVTGMKLGVYGWYTGHYQDFYDLSVEQVMP